MDGQQAFEDLHTAVQELQKLGVAYGDVKEQIAGVVAAQMSNREALAAIRASSSGDGASSKEPCWVLRPSSVWLHLPRQQAERVLQQEAQELAGQLEGLFTEQKLVLAAMEAEGLAPEHFRRT